MPRAPSSALTLLRLSEAVPGGATCQACPRGVRVSGAQRGVRFRAQLCRPPGSQPRAAAGAESLLSAASVWLRSSAARRRAVPVRGRTDTGKREGDTGRRGSSKHRVAAPPPGRRATLLTSEKRFWGRGEGRAAS